MKRRFMPEFRNRPDADHRFQGADAQILAHVVDKLAEEPAAQLADKRVHLEVDATAKAWLGEKGDHPHGARPLARVIQEHIKRPLADQLPSDSLKQGRQGRGDHRGRPSGLPTARPWLFRRYVAAAGTRTILLEDAYDEADDQEFSSGGVIRVAGSPIDQTSQPTVRAARRPAPSSTYADRRNAAGSGAKSDEGRSLTASKDAIAAELSPGREAPEPAHTSDAAGQARQRLHPAERATGRKRFVMAASRTS